MIASTANMTMTEGGPDVSLAPPDQVLTGPVAILWDMENCPIPVDVNTDEVAGNIRMALRAHPAVQGSVTIFSAYGDFNQFPRRLREGCQRTGINLIDIPNGRKDAADKAILADMFLFALDNPPPCTILLISGDVDFAPALHKLGQRGYSVLIAVPAAQAVASALCKAGRYIWDWPSVARGEGFVSAKALRVCTTGRNSPDNVSASRGLVFKSSDDQVVEDESCMWRRPGVELVDGITQDDGHQKRGDDVGLSGLGNFPSLEKQVPAAHIPTHVFTHMGFTQFVDIGIKKDNFDELWAQPGDIDGLKNQLIKLLKLNGGMLDFTRVSGEYKKLYGRPLFLYEYGSPKLADLFKRMVDTFEIATIGGKKILCLLERMPALQSMRADMSVCRKGAGQKNGYLSSTKVDDNDLVKEVILLRSKDQNAVAVNTQRVKEHTALSIMDDMALKAHFQERIVKLENFKREVQELLVSHGCRILLASFRKLYHQRYSHDLDLDGLGVTELDILLEKVQDVAVVKEEQGSKRKFLTVSNGGV